MGDPQDPDRELVAQALRGDQAAFGELVDRHQGLVASVAWRYGIPRDEIEDSVSEVFLKVYRRLDSYRPRHPFSTWLYRVAVNHVLDQGRRRQRRGSEAPLPEQLADGREDAREGLEREERIRLLRAALGELRANQREILFLVHVEGLKVADACRRLRIPAGTGKVRLMRGREQLKRILERRHPGYFGRAGRE